MHRFLDTKGFLFNKIYTTAQICTDLFIFIVTV
uniref:Uncharacterized protein n=1 Tax=Siphoviridae sp. ctTC45 TaxID=2827573 RepID=A0A8S5LQU3_9CAUD|nr:MAG TPA: hypothetical protein [Siphoviridae sp. ctTC45]